MDISLGVGIVLGAVTCLRVPRGARGLQRPERPGEVTAARLHLEALGTQRRECAGCFISWSLPATRLALGALVEEAVSGQAAAGQNWLAGAVRGPLPRVGRGGSTARPGVATTQT